MPGSYLHHETVCVCGVHVYVMYYTLVCCVSVCVHMYASVLCVFVYPCIVCCTRMCAGTEEYQTGME